MQSVACARMGPATLESKDLGLCRLDRPAPETAVVVGRWAPHDWPVRNVTTDGFVEPGSTKRPTEPCRQEPWEVADMPVEDLARRVQDAINVRRMFGEAYTSDGVTVIPVAMVIGGGGGGSGTSPEDGGSGEGGGFGGVGRPIGAYVIRDGDVTWRPAVDVNRAIVLGSTVLLVLIRFVSRVQRERARAAQR